VESKRYPRLHKLGSDGQYYTQAQIKDIVAYARDRGIRVVPEFDMPGHSTAWLVAYPQFSSRPGSYEIQRVFGGSTAIFDPSREDVYSFVDRFVGEMATLFPDRYWHIGGDEVDYRKWDTRRIRTFRRQHKLRNGAELQAYFNERLTRILLKHNRRLVGWDEIIHPRLPKTSVVQSWRGVDYLNRATSQGYLSILSAPYYLDHIRTTEEHYIADPIPPWTELEDGQQALVLGGEACMWAEHVSPETVDSRIWPRLAAIAERFWSPREVIQVGDMYRRLEAMSERLELVGLTHAVHTERMVRRITEDDSARVALQSMRRSASECVASVRRSSRRWLG
jgi:hexosaminidase